MTENHQDPMFPPGHDPSPETGEAPAEPSSEQPVEGAPSNSAPASTAPADNVQRLEQTLAAGFASMQTMFEAMLKRMEAVGSPQQPVPTVQPHAGATQQGATPHGDPMASMAQQAPAGQACPQHFQAPQHPQHGTPTPPPPNAGPQPQAPQIQPTQAGGQGKGAGVRDWLRDKLGGPGQPVAAQATPQARAQGGDDSRWQNILFGGDVANNQGLLQLRQAALKGLLGGQREATALVGSLLLFQAADSERMPQMLKDVGEAYYNWNPAAATGEDPMLSSLISYLHRKCESQGVSNTIVLVRPGDRFDATRHHSKQKGVEVARVHGWVVLRDNGKVYTKATVDVR